MEKKDSNLLGYSIFSSKSLSAWKKLQYYPAKSPKRLSQVSFVVSGEPGEASIIYPAIVSLKKRYPKTVVWVYTDRFNALLFENCVWVDRVKVVPVEDWRKLHWVESVSEAKKWIRKNRPEMGWVFSFSVEPLFCLIARLLAGDRVRGIVMDEDGLPVAVGNRWMQMFAEVRLPFLSDAVFARVCPFPSSFLCVWSMGLDLDISDSDVVVREEEPTGLFPNWEKDVVALSWQTQFSARMWNSHSWQRLARLLEERMNVDVWFVGIKDWGAIPSEFSNVKISMCNNILEWLYIVKRCKALVSVDNGLMHLAGLSDIPVLVLCGSKINLPYFGKDHIGIRKDVPCAPCWLQVCDKRYCIEDLKPEIVYELFSSGMLEKRDLYRLSSDLDLLIECWEFIDKKCFPVRRDFTSNADNWVVEVVLFLSFLSLWNEISEIRSSVRQLNVDFCKCACQVRDWCRDEKLFVSGIKLQINDLKSWEQRLSLLIMRLQELFPRRFPFPFMGRRLAIDLVNLWNSLVSFDENIPKLLTKLLVQKELETLEVRWRIINWISEKRFLLKMVRKYHSYLEDLVFENNGKSGRIKQ